MTSSSHHPKNSGPYKEFENPIYADTGPSSHTESNLYQSVSSPFLTLASSLMYLHVLHAYLEQADGIGMYYVPTTVSQVA